MNRIKLKYLNILIIVLCFNYSFCISSENKIASAKKIDNYKISLDGILNEEVWKSVNPLMDFLQKDPKEGEKPNGEIEMYFLYDEDYLYIGGKFKHNNNSEIRATTTRRDEAGNSERIIISLDTYRDKRTAYSFGLTATGVRIDYQHENDEEYNRDYSFDPVWSGSASIKDDSVWSAEIKIPFTQLRYNDNEKQEWGMNINWWIPSMREDVYWVLIPKNESGWSSKMGILTGIRNIKTSNRIELMPYAAGSLTYNPESDVKSPFYDKYGPDGRIGLDFKMGLSSDFSLDATINPDFGQVEADPAEVNLTAYETFFDEKRPFFIEGKQLLQGYDNSFFYSRRIGQAPKGSVSGDYINKPSKTNIIGAGKVTGRSKEGFSLGILTALTGNEYADYYKNDVKNEILIGPLTSYNVIRLKKDLSGEEVSSLGLMFTNVYRNISENDNLASVYTKNALTGDFDWFFRFDSSAYQFDGHFGFSYVSGSPQSILNLQYSSAHFFQRPDADYIDIDSGALSMAGISGKFQFEKIAGQHWLWEINGGFATPGLELNDIGILQYADYITSNQILRYRENMPGDIFYSYQLSLLANERWDFGGNSQSKMISFRPNISFHDRSTLNLELWNNFAAMSNSLTRGGPLMASFNSYGAGVEYNSDWTSNNQWNVSLWGNIDESDGWYMQFYTGISLKMFDRFSFSVNPAFFRSVNTRQFVNVIPDGREETYGKRYIFSAIERNTLSMQIRLNYAFTGDFTLEFYLEPFAANGKFYNYGELKKPKTSELIEYGAAQGTSIQLDSMNIYQIMENGKSFSIKNPDFNNLSFRSNLVLRWEFIPGSVLYLVWQQNRSESNMIGDGITAQSFLDSFKANGINTVALKISYWFPLD